MLGDVNFKTVKETANAGSEALKRFFGSRMYINISALHEMLYLTIFCMAEIGTTHLQLGPNVSEIDSELMQIGADFDKEMYDKTMHC